jgi:plasmid stabilization system protein ParE
MPARFRVEITRSAEQDLRAIYAYIEKDSPTAALRWFSELQRQIRTLEQFPKRCPIIPETGELGREYRHLIYGNYRTLFRVEGRRVIILRVLHAAQLIRLEVL